MFPLFLTVPGKELAEKNVVVLYIFLSQILKIKLESSKTKQKWPMNNETSFLSSV